jgi:hypothetical protein
MAFPFLPYPAAPIAAAFRVPIMQAVTRCQVKD